MKPYQLIANWKMNPQDETATLELAQGLDALKKNIWVAPPAIFLAHLFKKIPGMILGAQNMSAQPAGPFTGELSGAMIKNSGGSFVILGHSERKQFGETDSTVCEKIQQALSLDITPIVCMGEKEYMKDTNELQWEWDKQISTLFSDISPRAKLYAVYEPAWAISTTEGTLGSAPVQHIQRFHSWFRERFSYPLLYGGSINSESLPSFQFLPLDGFLIGSASLQLAQMQKIVTIIKDF